MQATMHQTAEEIACGWSDEQGKMVKALADKYGEPDVAGDTMLVWNQRGRWSRIVATKDTHQHDFPFSHTDFIECETPYHVPVDRVCDLAAFDGSVIVRRTDGTIAAKCHDEEANFLAINLANDIVTGDKTVDEARQAYLDVMIDYRAEKPTPYMEGLQFPEQQKTADHDSRMASPDQMRREAEHRKES